MPLTYILMFTFSIAMLLVAKEFEKNKIIKIGAYILAALSFFVVSAIRYNVGVDYFYTYAPHYFKLGHGLDAHHIEIGYMVIEKFCLLFTKDYQLLFAVTSAIIIGLTFYTIYKESPYPALSVAIYFLIGYFFHSLNIMREYLAISVLLFSYKYLIKKNYIKWIISVIIAFLLHSTSLIFVAAILLCDREIFDLKRTIIISILLFVFGRYVWEILVDLVISKTRFISYIGSKFDKQDIRTLDIIVNSILYIIIYYLYKNTKEVGRLEKFFLNVQALALFFMVSAATMYLLFRLSFYFGIFNIISIPYFLKKSDINKRDKIILIAVLMTTLCTNIYITNIKGNKDRVSPYKIVFNVKNRKYIDDIEE